MRQNLISIKLYQNATEYENFINFLALVLEIQCPQNFEDIHTDRQIIRHFLKKVKSCSGHLKTCKSIENRTSKIFMNPILSSYAYRRKSLKLHKSKHQCSVIYLNMIKRFEAIVVIFSFLYCSRAKSLFGIVN